METNPELGRYVGRISCLSFLVRSFHKLDQQGESWTDEKIFRLSRVWFKLEQNWDELQAIGKQIEARNGDDSEIFRYFDQTHCLLESLTTLIDGFDPHLKTRLHSVRQLH